MQAAEQIWLCPSRGRPASVALLRKAWRRVTGPEAQLMVGVDADDPELPRYQAGGPVTVCETAGLAGAINFMAAQAAPRCRFTGFLGDDHRPRTPGWNARLAAALGGRPGVAYGDDGLRGEEVPTAALISSELITCLGYMVPPNVEHLCHDIFWKEIGAATTLAYCPDVSIQHCHPSAGWAVWDEGYERANSPEAFERDWRSWNLYLQFAWAGDRARLLDHLERLEAA